MNDTQEPLYLAVDVENWKGEVLVQPAGEAGLPIHPNLGKRWREWLSSLINHPHSLPGVRVLKTSKTVEVLEARLALRDNETPVRVICKQVKIRGAKDALAGLFRRSSARRNFERASRLQKAGIGTATPLAWLERRSPRTSWLITEFLDDVIDLDAYVLTVLSRSTAGTDRALRNAIVRSLVEMFRGLQWGGLYHRDMKASNVLLANAGSKDNPPRVCIVDLDGLSTHRPWRSYWKPIVRLAASLLQYPAVTRTDYARFLREYLMEFGADRRAWRTHFTRLRKQAARYSQAAHKRKSDKLDGFSG